MAKQKCALIILMIGYLNGYSQNHLSGSHLLSELFSGYIIDQPIDTGQRKVVKTTVNKCSICEKIIGNTTTELFFESLGLPGVKLFNGSIRHFYLLTDSTLIIKQLIVLLDETDSTRLLLKQKFDGRYKEKYSWGSEEDNEEFDVDYNFGTFGIYVHLPQKKISAFDGDDVFILQAHPVKTHSLR